MRESTMRDSLLDPNGKENDREGLTDQIEAGLGNTAEHRTEHRAVLLATSADAKEGNPSVSKGPGVRGNENKKAPIAI